ncbi:MAG: hypothetical protein Q8L26_06825 [Candidatus Omnitrophota bacterium]|nr:hypothetical protein [Candidatus Omnitrophota bacterium]
MNKFEILFGAKVSEMKKTCILMPYLHKGLLADFGIKKISRGKLYGIGQSRFFTLIHAGIGPTLTGDAVLYLKETGVKNLILFGSCGLIKETAGLNIGSLVSPSKAYNLESFSRMLENKINFETHPADRNLLKDFLENNKTMVKKVTCATIGSLKLEEELESIKGFAEVIDMECSAFFAAAGFIKRPAIALFYVADIVNNKPFYASLNQKEKNTIFSSTKKSASILSKFIENGLRYS